MKPMAGSALLIAFLSLAAVAADDYPSRPIRLIVPGPAGVGIDLDARPIAQKMGELLRQPMVIENRPAAGGIVAMEAAAKAAPDGYTLIVAGIGQLASFQYLYRKLPYDPERDFTPVSLMQVLPSVLTVHPSLGVSSVRELIALAKARPGEITFASQGNGTFVHMAGEFFKAATGVDLRHIPYGAQSPFNDLAGGHVMAMFSGIAPGIGNAKAGKLKILAVSARQGCSSIKLKGTNMSSAVVAGTDRTRFSREIAALNMKPLWERVMRLGAGTAAVPAIWRWKEVRPLLERACELITATEAERRVLMLENPALEGTTFITTTLYAGLQAILPNEIAPTHRHTPNALRFIVEGEGAYTAIDGERAMMKPGDFVVTPGWAWHDHGNVGTKPVVWLDGLDIAFANIMGAHFREDFPQESQRAPHPEGDSAARYGANLLPVDRGAQGHTSPILSYPYERTRAALEQLSKNGDAHASHGWKLRYANPATGSHAFPTMAVFMQWLPKGFSGRD